MTRIVLADDHPFLRAGVEEVLRGCGIEIAASVNDGAAALEAVEKENPDVVILDVRMPGMGGVAVLETLRARGDERPVILLTAELTDASLLSAVKARVDGIVFKDGAESSLSDAIKAVLAGTRYIDQPLIERALDLAIEPPQQARLARLSPREQQIAEAVSAGRRNRDIAEEIGTTEGSVKVYLHRIYEKLGVGSRTELAVLVLKEKGG
ncbi:LuxR family transcriptional regulator [Erythrobacter sp. SG61-1L]|uniref:response regulator n=1 Tax=Erythrobacter sp. SG61-1L TaxID=1603897 RepID=UPI0006C9010D|nr:response regulator transcription factor [Erythrobacter sp. SG61-1L]KPL68249.1 LuxR family transcriptional regulator [Erythrobacter sp. SG61-1L]